MIKAELSTFERTFRAHLYTHTCSLWVESLAKERKKKSFKLVWWCHQLLSGFLANGHLPRVSLQSCLSANDKSDNGLKPGAVHRSPDSHFRRMLCLSTNVKGDYDAKPGIVHSYAGIYLTAVENFN